MLERSLTLVLDAIADRLDGPLVIADVGAQILSGEAHVYQKLIDARLPVRVIGFEPQADRAAERRAAEPGVTIIETFIGDGQAHPFHLNNASATSSLLELDRTVCAGVATLAGLCTVGIERVATMTLDDALADEPWIDLLKLDIQGAELMALRGGSQVLRRTAVVQAEVEFVPIYAAQPLFSDVEQHLRRQRFELIDLMGQARRPPVVPSGRLRAERLLWADAIFTADTTRSDRTLLAQAILLAGVYGKICMAEQALAAYDKRHDTSLAELIAALS